VNRRAFVTGLGALLATPAGVAAQPAVNKVAKIGWLSTSPPMPGTPEHDAFWEQMHRFGFVLNDNARWEFPALLDDELIQAAADLLQRQVDVIISVGPSVVVAQPHLRHRRAGPLVPRVLDDAHEPARRGDRAASLSTVAAALNGGTSDERVWMACGACGARIERPVETPEPP
jgi:ABC-type sugar transport system substrate-binding protein